MALSDDVFIEPGNASDRRLKSDRAAAGTYFVGTFVEWDGPNGIVNPATGSAGNAKADNCIVGMVTQRQVIAAIGGQLRYESGPFILPVVGALPKANGVVFLANDTSVQASQGTNLTVAGRFIGHVSGATGTALVDVGNTPSGSFTTIGGKSLFVGG